MSLCIVCRQRPAAVPDRERMGRPVKRVCRECHVERLKADIHRIIRRLAAQPQDGEQTK